MLKKYVPEGQLQDIFVVRRHLEEGIPWSIWSCAVAKALNEQTGKKWEVTPSSAVQIGVDASGYDPEIPKRIKFSRRTSFRIAMFDFCPKIFRKLLVRPFKVRGTIEEIKGPFV